MREGRAIYRAKGEPYAGSRRYYRGRIVDALRALPDGRSLPFPNLGSAIRPDYDDAAHGEWLRGLIGGLIADRLVAMDDENARLP